MKRIRIAYAKGEQLQYVGNLDLHRIWERTFRRAGISLAYSQGFHPQPRMHQACPLPLGFTSRAELLDFWCDADTPLEDHKSRLVNTVQPGINIQTLTEVPLNNAPLQTLVAAACYQVTFDDAIDLPETGAKVDAVLRSEHLPRERRGKPYDLRPLIESLSFDYGQSPAILTMRLTTLPSATGRPEEVLDVLGINPFSVDVVRTELILNPVQ